jgi:hypothetical protein
MHAANILPPEVNTRQVGHEYAARHHEVEVSDDKVGLGQVDVDAELTEEDTGEIADSEQSREAEG